MAHPSLPANIRRGRPALLSSAGCRLSSLLHNENLVFRLFAAAGDRRWSQPTIKPGVLATPDRPLARVRDEVWLTSRTGDEGTGFLDTRSGVADDFTDSAVPFASPFNERSKFRIQIVERGIEACERDRENAFSAVLVNAVLENVEPPGPGLGFPAAHQLPNDALGIMIGILPIREDHANIVLDRI